MKMIKAYVRAARADTVLEGLARAGIFHATLTQVTAVGPNIDPKAKRVSVRFGRRVEEMIKIELICPDRDENKLVEIIRETGCTRQPGDGVIAVQNVNRLVKIRTASESLDAL